jgi:adenine-specific DNA-methyltransferase
VSETFQQIWHGDSKVECLKFKPGRVNCVITDPPFGVDNQSNMAVTSSGRDHARKIAGDADLRQARMEFTLVMEALAPKLSTDADLYVFTAGAVLGDWITLLDSLGERYGFVRKAILVWEKDGPGIGDLDSWGQGHEFIIFCKKGRRPASDRRRSGVLHVPQLRPSELIHPHEKPEGLLELLIRASSDPGDFIVDPFGGSGSLARAARNTGRSAVCIEVDERNYEAASRKFDSTQTSLI